MTDRYKEIEGWTWCPWVGIFYREGHADSCSGQHELVYRKASQCSMELQFTYGSLRCEEDEGHGDNGKLPVHGAKDGDGLMIWWQSV